MNKILPNPLTNTEALAYFLTASIPIAPIYLDHLSFTSSLSKFNSF